MRTMTKQPRPLASLTGLVLLRDDRLAARTIVVSLLLAVLVAQAVASMRQKSVTFDEIFYIPAGYYHLKTGDFKMNMTNPPLMKLISAAGLLALGPILPPMESPPADWSMAQQWRYGQQFLYNNRVPHSDILFAGRVGVMLVTAVLAVYVYRFGRRLYGYRAGVCALTLYCFCPNILAHGRLATHDLGLAAMMLASCYHFWVYMDERRMRSLLACGVAAGLALLVKTAAVLLAPVFALAALFCIVRGDGRGVLPGAVKALRLERMRPRIQQLVSLLISALGVSICVLVVLNAGYGFQGSFDFSPELHAPESGSSAPARAHFLASAPIPMPAAFRQLIAFQSELTEGAGGTFFAGRRYSEGLWYQMLASVGMKTPVPLLLGVVVGAVVLVWQLPRFGAEWLLIGLIIMFLGLFSYLANVNVGLRYVLPIYPAMHVLVSRWIGAGQGVSWLRRGALGVLLVWYVGGTLRVFPDYLAYFNEVAGGPDHGYRLLVDSNLDWGQDLPALSQRLTFERDKPIYLSYFGVGYPPAHGIDASQVTQLPSYLPWTNRPPEALRGGLYCISASTFQQRGLLTECRLTIALEDAYQQHKRRPAELTPADAAFYENLKFLRLCALLRQREPDEFVGHSILLYELTDDDIARALDGPPPEQVDDTPGNLFRVLRRCVTSQQYLAASIFCRRLLDMTPAMPNDDLVAAAAETAASLEELGRDKSAVKVLRLFAARAPDHAGILNNLAWILATSPDEQLRDGQQAVQLAEQANAVTGGRNPGVLDTLAAAYAAAGDFDQAVRVATEAQHIASSAGASQLTQEINGRLELYRRNQAYLRAAHEGDPRQ